MKDLVVAYARKNVTEIEAETFKAEPFDTNYKESGMHAARCGGGPGFSSIQLVKCCKQLQKVIFS